MGGNPKELTPALKQVLMAAHAGLMAAAIMAAGCGGGNTSTREGSKQKPDPLQESLSRMSEDLKRDRELSREAMAELVTETEALDKETLETLAEHAAMKSAPGARRAEALHRGGERKAGARKIRLASFRQKIESFADDELPILGPYIGEEHRAATRRNQQAREALEAAQGAQ